jgi:hypothetical protein
LSEPFMEHPTGAFPTAIDAMKDAVVRLRALPSWDQWITFCAQGQGNTPESVQIAEVRMKSDRLDIGNVSIDPKEICRLAEVRASISVTNEQYIVSTAEPGEVAQILDAIFRHHFKIRPFPDEDDDYAVGAEW